MERTEPVTDIYFFQKVVVHYRIPLFRALHERYGWKVLTSEHLPEAKGLQLIADGPFIVHAPMKFFRNHPDYPTTGLSLFDHLPKPVSLISEFSLRFPATYLFAAARRLGRIERLAFHTHGRNLMRAPDTRAAFISDVARLTLFRAADVVATYTAAGAAWINEAAPGVITVPIENSIDVSVPRAAAAVGEPLRLGFPQLLFCSRLLSIKKAPLMLDLFDRLAPRFPELRIVVIGGGEDYDKMIKGHRNRGDDSRIMLIDELYDEAQLAPWFMGSDLLVLPGHGGLSINHAFAYGLPVIAFGPGGQDAFHAPEIDYVKPGKTGVLVDPATGIDGMASAIADLFENKTRLEIIRAAIPAFVDEHLGIETMVHNFGRIDDILRS